MNRVARRSRMMAAGLAMAAAILPHPGQAAVRIDDSGTVVGQPLVQMRWRQLTPGRAMDPTVEGQLRVALRLDVAAFRNQPARIYMVLAPVAGQTIEASWRTQGRLLPGRVRSGARALIFEGRIPAPRIEETIEITFTADGRELSGTHALRFSFELETP